MPAVLTLLRIKNLALVEELEWEIAPGFIAVTGETGAGKSIIIGALQLLLGERADKSLIRTGADFCTVEAVWTGDDLPKVNPQLVEGGIDPCENDLIIKRSFSATGGTRQFINGSPTTLSILKNLGDDLVDLHGPHDHQSLLSPDRQLSLLDSFARAEGQLDEYRKNYRQLQTVLSEHTALNTAETAREQELDLLRHQTNEIKSAQLVAGEALRKLRTKAAPKLSETIRRNLRDLGFRQSEFEAKLDPLDEPRPHGFDAVELLFSPNPGEPLKPLRAIASSGEISRLMLAIKSALAAHDAIPLLVFDEIDTNVGGEIAHAVGAKMQTLGREHQVICITHLPQVAATASSHFVVTKEVVRGRTYSQLREISGKGRKEEIARMLGGKSESALKLAATLLKEQ
jgi:DNA repair ATPase RecN